MLTDNVNIRYELRKLNNKISKLITEEINKSPLKEHITMKWDLFFNNILVDMKDLYKEMHDYFK